MRNVTSSTLWLGFVLPLAVLLIHSSYYYPYFADDAFISLRYAARLIAGKGLTWNDGEHVEGYSNLLWVLLTAGLGALGINLLAAARTVCVLASVSTLLALFHFGQRRGFRTPVVFFGNLACALAGPVAIWTIGGLETTLTMALLASSYALTTSLMETPNRRRAALCGVLLAAVCLNRPEGPIFVIAVALGLVLCADYSRRSLGPCLFALCGIPLLAVIGQLGFRLDYYGDWLPNPFYVKVAFTRLRLMTGAIYCVMCGATFLPLALVVLLKCDSLKRSAYATARRNVVFLAIVCVAWTVVLAVGGGDIFPGCRHLLPLVPALLMMLMESMQIMYDSGAARQTHAFCATVLACFFWLQLTFTENLRARHEPWLWETKELADWLRHQYGDRQPVVAVTLAGIIPFYSGLPSIDMYGLCDPYIAKHRSDTHGYGPFGAGYIGHELFNSEYVLSRKPDIIIFHTGDKPAHGVDPYSQPLYGIDRHPGFAAYRPLLVTLPSYTAEIWIRKDSDKFGVLPEARPGTVAKGTR